MERRMSQEARDAELIEWGRQMQQEERRTLGDFDKAPVQRKGGEKGQEAKGGTSKSSLLGHHLRAGRWTRQARRRGRDGRAARGGQAHRDLAHLCREGRGGGA